LEFAGANNPLWIVRNDGSLEDIKGTRKGINAGAERSHINFKNHEIQLSEGDRFFIFSDGYQDQFGGQKGKKFMAKKFKNFLVETSVFPINTQGKKVKDIKKDIFVMNMFFFYILKYLSIKYICLQFLKRKSSKYK